MSFISWTEEEIKKIVRAVLAEFGITPHNAPALVAAAQTQAEETGLVYPTGGTQEQIDAYYAAVAQAAEAKEAAADAGSAAPST